MGIKRTPKKGVKKGSKRGHFGLNLAPPAKKGDLPPMSPEIRYFRAFSENGVFLGNSRPKTGGTFLAFFKNITFFKNTVFWPFYP